MNAALRRAAFGMRPACPAPYAHRASLITLRRPLNPKRDSATKPRVARNELPWENSRPIGANPERVVADDNGNKTMPQPRWGCELSVTFNPAQLIPRNPGLSYTIPLGLNMRAMSGVGL